MSSSTRASAIELWHTDIPEGDKEKLSNFRLSFEAQIAMFPNRVTPKIAETIKSYKNEALGWKISGAGGGGYLMLVSEKRVENAMQVKIRRI